LTAFFLILVLLVVGGGILLIRQGRSALATTSLMSHMDPNAAAEAVKGVFKGFGSGNWRSSAGPGQLNFVTNTPGGGTTTLSVDIRAAGGGSEVSMWASGMSTQFGVPKGGGAINAKKKKIAKKLARG
jgi:hypothetical protein